MTKPKPKRNKRHTPRAILADPVSWAVAGAHLVPHSKVDALFEPIDAAVSAMKSGRATRDDWMTLAQACNLAEALAFLQVGHNLTAEIAAGQAALMAFAKRMIGGSTSCHSEEVAAIDEALFVYKAQLKVCTQGDLSKALARVKAIHTSGAMLDVANEFEAVGQAARL